MSVKKLTLRRIFDFICKKGFSAWRILLIIGSLIVSLGLTVLSYGESDRPIVKNEHTFPLTTTSVGLPPETTVKKDFRVENYILTQRLAKGSWNYCKVEHCETITCSDIPVNMNPGEIISLFIAMDFKPLCTTTQSINLIFRNCKFSSNKLQKDWLPIDVPIKKLELNACSLVEVTDDVFSQSIFEETKVVSLIDNRISSFRRAMFLPLHELQVLNIEDNIIANAESNLLKDVADSLETLVLNRAIKDVQVLRNITGKDTLKKLQVLSLKGNSIPTVNREVILGGSMIRSFYLDGSGVTTIEPMAFEVMANSLEQLFMSRNNVSSLPAGLFDHIIQRNPRFRLTVDGNPWHCDCSLKWMKEFVKMYPAVVSNVPVCQTPARNALVTFLQAVFCDESVGENTPSATYTSGTTSTNNPDRECTSMEKEENTVTTNEKYVKVACINQSDYLLKDKYSLVGNDIFSLKMPLEEKIMTGQPVSRKLLSTVDYEILKGFNHFSTVESEDGSVLVKLPKLNDVNVSLIWFRNTILDSGLSNQCISKSIQCVRNVQGSVLLKDLEAGTPYTICLLDSEKKIVYPLNCLALSTSTSYKAQAWLLNKDKSLTLSVSSLVLLAFGLISALAMYLVIRQYPNLLRGSKRVVMVKHRKLDALVLPKDLEIDVMKENLSRTLCGPELKERKDDGYITPLAPIESHCKPIPSPSLCRKGSRASAMSFHSFSNSYVSGIEPTYSQLMAWRLSRMKCENKCGEIEPPPLPPHHPKLCRISSCDYKSDCAIDEILEEPFSIL